MHIVLGVRTPAEKDGLDRVQQVGSKRTGEPPLCTFQD